MSDLRSPVVSDGVTVRKYSAASVGTVQTLAPSRRGQAYNSHELLEEQKKIAVENAEKLGIERGHAKGFLQGYGEGKDLGILEAKREAAQEIQERLDAFVKELTCVSENLQVNIEHWFEASEEQMTDLAMDAVRKILASELAISRDSALEQVKQALQEVTHSRHARIRINPFDAPMLREHRQQILAAAGSLRDIEFVSDSSIPGGCIIETDGGMVDATSDTKMELLENELRRAS